MSNLSPAYMDLAYRPDLRVLFLRWTRQTTSQELRAAYDQTLELARQEQAGRWLIDLRRRSLADPADFAWIVHDVRARLAQGVAGAEHRIAYLVTPNNAPTILGRLAELEPDIPAAVRTAVAFRIFTEEHTALEWLQA
ncbi:hypothetical protein FY528_06560 [Hymenobacter lutimineralis]|uniref:STAS/SEC14 domain-containing protein n=1 Tax=Hymenobacter lutimineralis TaxID=2606448 RepID=A0A5D6V746_9BACT|nr:MULTISPECIES: STAS/SEC14 domain-containing protein [Hymenobacter]QIX61634.1 hypothetical protein HER32_10770 [Hymenobacter sp. BT18]TYZ11356.1 hypothetical protein FY528_06560 [Hymenobacter lutimineralis]